MLFNSLDFAVFLPLVFILYWSIKNQNIQKQNLLVVIASYIFYGWWDWRFLTLILFSTIIDYTVAIKLFKEQTKKKRKILLLISILVNIGLLGFFKYYNFFLENFINAFSVFGVQISCRSLNIILPVGISFYTFQTLSYTIDIYKKKLNPTKDFIAFAAFVSFFPQLVAGPIERAANLLPQFYKKRKFVYHNATNGMRQILWGFFKKLVIADNCAIYANEIFNNYHLYSGSTLLLGATFFAFQIYGDFSGYSDIAIGTSRLFGFNLRKNFSFPYFSRDIAEFWRRWHISLSTWFRDYLYIPLGGSKGGKLNMTRNIFIIFLISGFWHGSNWTFIFWGALNAIYFIPLALFNRNRENINIVAGGRLFPNITELLQIFVTFFITTIAWIFFRSEDITQAFKYLQRIFDNLSFISIPELISPKIEMIYTIFCLIIFIIIEWLNREKEYGLEIHNLKKYYRWSIYFFISFLIITFGVFNKTEFIYFQF